MNSEKMRQSIINLNEFISNINSLEEDSEVRLVKSQLKVIEKSIRQFEKDGIQVPQGILSDKVSLETKLNKIKQGPQEIVSLYDELLELILKAAEIIKRRPEKDLYLKKKENRKKELPRNVLRMNILSSLKDMGGSGREKEVLQLIKEKLKDKFSDSELEKPYGKMARWEMNVRKVRNIMIKEGILTPDSRRRIWTLK